MLFRKQSLLVVASCLFTLPALAQTATTPAQTTPPPTPATVTTPAPTAAPQTPAAVPASSGTRVHGTIMDPDGELIPGASVTFTPAKGAGKAVLSGSDGTYTVTLA